MKSRCLAAAVLAGALGLAACGDDDGGEVPNTNNNTNNNTNCAVQATFSSIYTNRLNTVRCATAGCHDAGSQGGGLNFQKEEAEVLADLVNVMSSSAPTKLRVVPNDSANSFLWQKLSDPMVEGALGPMPPGGMLDACEIDAVAAWIDAGAN